MIERYSRKVMRDIWTEENKFRAYLEVEILSCEAWSELGVIPREDVDKIRAAATFSVDRIKEIEQITRHDVVAFTRAVSESLGPERKWVHYGLTSTDVVDTANGYLLRQANAILEKDLEEFLAVLKRRALEFKETPCIGRTHGIHADITSFGLKWALWYEEMKRNIERFQFARKGVEAGKMSGAVGNFANIPPSIQDYVCEHLGIASADISTQVLQRDRHAYYIATLAIIASTLEQMAFEVRNLQRTEVREVEEAFGKGQKGSSAMPHKRNPISSENICGCARVMRGYMSASCENVALWHERDISHSSTERIILPDATELLDYMLCRFKGILENLVVYPENMMANIWRTRGVIFAQRVMNALIGKGLTREQAYDTVQPIAMKAWTEGLDYRTLLKESEAVMGLLTVDELEGCFTLDYYFGLQWGDEGKGKVVDVLTPNYKVIARFQGGPNAGHSLVFDGDGFVLHTVPSGIFRPDSVNIIGNGVVIDPVILQDEIEAIEAKGVDITGKLFISKKAHLILPTHRMLDAASEAAKGKGKIGSTLKGIGPTYMDKTGRNGLRVGDILSPEFIQRYEALKYKHFGLLAQYKFPFDITDYELKWFQAIESMRRFTFIDSEFTVNRYLDQDAPVLAEGAQGSMLDIDFGTYPFVTSSNTMTAGVCTGLGVAPPTAPAWAADHSRRSCSTPPASVCARSAASTAPPRAVRAAAAGWTSWP